MKVRAVRGNLGGPLAFVWSLVQTRGKALGSDPKLSTLNKWYCALEGAGVEFIDGSIEDDRGPWREATLRRQACRQEEVMLIDSTKAAGWVVQLIVPGAALEGGGSRGPPLQKAPSFQFFNVAIGSANAAVEAVRHKVKAADDAPIRVVRSLSVGELAAIGLRSGQIKPA